MDAGEILDELSREVRELSLGCTDYSVSCHFTPDGRADAVVEAAVESDLLGLGYENGDGGQEGGGIAEGDARGLVFASALVEVLPFPEALNHVLRSSRECSVAYLQQQNNCFPLEFSALSDDADGDIGWASQALGCKPEAVNLWIGTQDSVTSFHKDHYENLYAVVSGEKHFTLLPPTDVHRMYVKKYPIAHYERTDSGSLVLKHDDPTSWVPWVSVDPSLKDSDLQTAKSQYPRYFEGPPAFECSLRAGELLYLPSLWFHHVRQTPDTEGRTIALNYWYDMQFDMKYAYFNLVESLTASSSVSETISKHSNS
ncbi:hypothetical protein M758_6G093600 [Ceratodon purpureus]|nr:hypothetical protein M758_6G093600 [Ceratodon purpureus]